MSGFTQNRWIHNLLDRSGLRSLVEKYHHELEQHQQAAQTLRNWKALLLSSRTSIAYPILIGTLAMISAGTGMYPFAPILIAAVVFAPFRWRTIYLSAVLGAATGAGLLALTIQLVSGQQFSGFFTELFGSVEGTRTQQWIKAYGSYALAVIAALPVPEMPALITLIVSKTPPWMIWLAILAGKLVKYGMYILAVQLILRAIRLRHIHTSTP